LHPLYLRSGLSQINGIFYGVSHVDAHQPNPDKNIQALHCIDASDKEDITANEGISSILH
jgi:hypothetical protein